jgi:hypothetical protein
MKNYTKNKPLFAIEKDIAAAFEMIENATEENAAANGYNALKSHINQYLILSKELRKQFYSQRETISHQAKKLSDIDLEIAIGESAPTTPLIKSQPSNHTNPEVLTIQNSPDFFFIQLSFGKVNIRHIALLDMQTKQLILSGGITRHLTDEDDLKKLNYYLTLYKNT